MSLSQIIRNASESRNYAQNLWESGAICQPRGFRFLEYINGPSNKFYGVAIVETLQLSGRRSLATFTIHGSRKSLAPTVNRWQCGSLTEHVVAELTPGAESLNTQPIRLGPSRETYTFINDPITEHMFQAYRWSDAQLRSKLRKGYRPATSVDGPSALMDVLSSAYYSTASWAIDTGHVMPASPAVTVVEPPTPKVADACNMFTARRRFITLRKNP